MNCWEILGIEPTWDREIIQQAYEIKVKEIDQEDVVLLQKIDEAVDTAIFLSGSIIESGRPKEMISPSLTIRDSNNEGHTENTFAQLKIINSEKIDIENPEDEEIFETKLVKPSYPSQTESIESETKSLMLEESVGIAEMNTLGAVRKFRQELAKLYESRAFFSEKEKWLPLFIDQKNWTSDEHTEISELMQQFLLTNYQMLSRGIIDYLGTCFDFDSLTKEVKEGNYFCYTWSEIKQVPPFSFNIYREIQKEERLTYFTERYELFQTFKKGIPDQQNWQRRLDQCFAITANDDEVVNLQICYLLMNDFRLEHEQTVSTFYLLIGDRENSNLSKARQFFNNYVDWAIKDGGTNNVLIYDTSETMLPDSAVHLLKGYVYFHLKRHSRLKDCWKELDQQHPDLFSPEEHEMLQGISTAGEDNENKSIRTYIRMFFLVIVCFKILSAFFKG